MNNRLRWFGLVLSAALVLASEIAAAGGTADGFVRSRQGDLLGLMAQPKSSAREQKIASIMDQVFDYDELARRSSAMTGMREATLKSRNLKASWSDW